MTKQLTPEAIKGEARKLWAEYKDTHLMLYSPAQRAGYTLRSRNLAGKISLAETGADTNLAGAVMYLDQVALWLEWDLTPYFQK